ncbi:MAG: HEAT repeat domain-containing protein [Actinobacteria bacterium]|nr:HEAT repeat domain-containing protein [Actinomycetota bacterium]
MNDVEPTGSSPPGRPRRLAAIAGHEGDPGVARQLLGHPEARTRATALAALARRGGLGIDTLREALADPSPIVRRRAVVMAVAHPEVSLVALLADVDDTVVEAAAYACGERLPPEPGAVAALSAVATGHGDGLCREAAVAALGALGDPAGLPAVLAATRDRATVRRRAVIALAPFSGAEVNAALERAKGDRDWQVRQAAEDIDTATQPDDQQQ